MNHAQRLRDLAARTGLDGFADELRAMAGEIEADAGRFRGDDAALARNITALIELSDAGALVPHSLGGHARALLAAAASRLSARPAAQPAETHHRMGCAQP